MIDQTAPLLELPDYWQEHVFQLRSENHELRTRLRADGTSFVPKLDELPQRWQKHITDLRKDCGRFRRERNEARAALEQSAARHRADAGSLVNAGLMVCGYGGAACSRCNGSQSCYRVLV